jgi:hypothetical protein
LNKEKRAKLSKTLINTLKKADSACSRVQAAVHQSRT